MKQDDLKKIADAISAGITAKKAPLPGCGSASSSGDYTCGAGGSYYGCSTYECGGAGNFNCYTSFICSDDFQCYSDFDCYNNFGCTGDYNP